MWRSQCPSGYLCPSRVDDEQGEKKQEMKRQGDKKNFKEERTEAKIVRWNMACWDVEKEKGVLMASFG